MSKELTDLLVALAGLINRINAVLDKETCTLVNDNVHTPCTKPAPMCEQVDEQATCTQHREKERVSKFLLEEVCPICGRSLIRRQNSDKHVFFVGCTGFDADPKCRYTTTWDANRFHMVDKDRQYDVPKGAAPVSCVTFNGLSGLEPCGPSDYRETELDNVF